MKSGVPTSTTLGNSDSLTIADGMASPEMSEAIGSNTGGGGGGGLASSIISAVGNIAATVGSIISSKETTKQAGLNKEIATLQIEASSNAVSVEQQKTLQASIAAKKAELIAVQRSENIKTFTNTAMVFGVLTVVSLVAYWVLRPAKPKAALAPVATPVSPQTSQ